MTTRHQARDNILHPEISAAFDYPDFPRVPMEFQVFASLSQQLVPCCALDLEVDSQLRLDSYTAILPGIPWPTSNTVAAVSGKLPFKDRICTSWGLKFGCALARSQA